MRQATRGFLAAVLATSLSTLPAVAGSDELHDGTTVLPGTHREESVGALGQGLEVQQQNGISFVSGGVGDEQQDVLDSVVGRFNLKVTLARQDGKYMGSSALRIEDQRGSDLLQTESKGPLFLAKLPAGTYTVHASAEGRSFSRKVTVPSAGLEQIVLTWPSTSSSAGDAPGPGQREP